MQIGAKETFASHSHSATKDIDVKRK